MGYFGSAHPLVVRAIRHGCRLPGAISVNRGDHVGLLLTFEMEISHQNRVVFRETIAVMARPDLPPVESGNWLSLGMSRYSDSTKAVWDQHFAYWATQARVDTDILVGRLGAERHGAFLNDSWR